MRYCKTCISCDTRPNLVLDDEGICNACRNHQLKATIDWDERASEFLRLAGQIRERAHGYDCLIPVSGGKDSTWQTLTCLRHGLTPLTYSYVPPLRTEVGRRNLDNLISLGVDHFEYRINPDVERTLLLESFERLGNPGVLMHRAIYNTSRRLACQFKIPVVVWGEDSVFEYGGRNAADPTRPIDEDWLSQFNYAGRADGSDWVNEVVDSKSTSALAPVSDSEIEAAGVRDLFLGRYFRWDPVEVAKVAMEAGMQVGNDGPRTGAYDFSDMDDELISVHHYLKWFKFGFTRSFDNLSIEIRNGRLNRAQAVAQLRKSKEQRPDADIKAFCGFTDISVERFDVICEGFRNPDIWYRDGAVWKIRDFLIPDWKWI